MKIGTNKQQPDIIEESSLFGLHQQTLSTTAGIGTSNGGLGNISTTNLGTFQNTTIVEKNPYHIPSCLRTTTVADMSKDFHKKLQSKLDNLQKKKDYQLMLKLTQQKIKASEIQNSPSKTISNSKPSHSMPLSSSSVIQIPKISLGFAQAAAAASGVDSKDSMGYNDAQIEEGDDQSGEISPIGMNKTINKRSLDQSRDSDASDNQELEKLLAEGQYKKKKKHPATYQTGTKSTLCRRFMKLGQCPLGKKCEYAHSKKELKFNAPQDWLNIVKNMSTLDNPVYNINDTRDLTKDLPKNKFIGENVATNGTKSLMEACKIDDYMGVEQLIKSGSNPIAQDFSGQDALYYCVTYSSFNCLKRIIELSYEKIPADRTYGKKRRNILTSAAIHSNDIRILDYLLNNTYIRFNPNSTDRFQRNAVFYSLFRNKVEAVQMFIEAESALDIPDLRGMCIIDYALQFNYEEMMLELIKGGARLGYKQNKGIAIMQFAAQNGNIEVIKALISKNVPLSSIPEDSDQNCLMVALSAKQYDLIVKLIEYIADVKALNQQDTNHGENILMKAIDANEQSIVELISKKAGMKFSTVDKTGKTALIHAAEKNSEQFVQNILDNANPAEIDVNAYDHRGRTALIYAVMNKNLKIVNTLLSYKLPDDQTMHIKWQDELQKDVCEYAMTDKIKVALCRYIEDHALQYHNYYSMKASLSIEYMSKKRFPYVYDSNESSPKRFPTYKRRNEIVSQQQIKQVQLHYVASQKTYKNKLRLIEDDINRKVQEEKSENQEDDLEKAKILKLISQKRLKALRTIAVKFPKLNNLEGNVKFKQAIKQLYDEADLSKYVKPQDHKRMSVNEIIESHSPAKVLLRHKRKQRRSSKQQQTDSKLLDNISPQYSTMTKAKNYVTSQSTPKLPKIKSTVQFQLQTIDDQPMDKILVQNGGDESVKGSSSRRSQNTNRLTISGAQNALKRLFTIDKAQDGASPKDFAIFLKEQAKKYSSNDITMHRSSSQALPQYMQSESKMPSGHQSSNRLLPVINNRQKQELLKKAKLHLIQIGDETGLMDDIDDEINMLIRHSYQTLDMEDVRRQVASNFE